jgi:hypothetical protein
LCADAHPRYDPQPGNTGGGEQRAHVTIFRFYGERSGSEAKRVASRR